MKSFAITLILSATAVAWKPVTYANGGAVEYFGDNGKDYGVAQKADSTTYTPNGVSSSSSTSWSSSSSDSGEKLDLNHLNTHHGADALADIVGTTGYGGVGAIGGRIGGGHLRAFGSFAPGYGG